MSFRPHFLELAEEALRKGTYSVTESENAAQTAATKAAVDAAVSAAMAGPPPAGDGTRDSYDKEYVARLRREAEDHRKRADTLQSEKDGTERATLEANKEFEKIAAHERSKREASDTQHAAELAAERASNAAERTSNDARFKRKELESVAAKHGLLDVSDIDKIDVTSLQMDDNGRIVGADAIFEALKTKKPHYFKVEAAAPVNPVETYSGLRRPPQPSPKPVSGGVDVYALNDAEFADGWKSLGKFQRA